MRLLTLPFRLVVVLLKLLALIVAFVGLPFVAISTALFSLGGVRVCKLIKFRKPRRLPPEIVGEILRVHSSCVNDQSGKCPLLVSVSSLTWELNQAANIGNEEVNAFKRHDPMCTARPLSDHDIERIVEGRRLANSMMEEPE